MTYGDKDEQSGDERTVSRRGFLGGSVLVGAGLLTPVLGSKLGSAQTQPTTLTVRIENVSTGSTLATTGKGPLANQPVPLSPGAWAVHTPGEPIFSAGEPERNNGLEELAEDGSPSRLVESLQGNELVTDAGAFTTPVDADSPGPIGPGGAYEFTVQTEQPSDRLSLVTMFVPSNDLFYALGGTGGLTVHGSDGSSTVDGDVTDSVALWDAGTEINEEPGVGENQVQRQRGAGVGLVERGTVVPVESVNGYDYPDVGDVIEVTVSPSGDTGTPTTATPDTPTEEPGTPTEEPGTPTEEPGTPTEEPGTPTEAPGTPTEEPGKPTEEPGTPTEEPGTPTEEPGTPTEEPGTPTEEPGTPTEEPGTETDTPGGTETGTPPGETETPEGTATPEGTEAG